jgi:ribonuclease P protein component
MSRLKIRADFLRASSGVRRVTPSVTLELCKTPDGGDGLRVGFTATKKLGGAVVRNRAKRRLRSAAAAVLPLCGRAGNDYVLVARRDTLTRPYDQLLADLTSALTAAHARQAQSSGERRS